MLGLLFVLATVSWGFTPLHHEGGGEEIRWRADRKLTWRDFKGRPDRLSNMDALTESGISFSWSCDHRGFKVEIFSMMIPGKSWVKEKSAYLLAHEQAHFDITELHARKLRKAFDDVRNPCSLGKAGINKIAEKWMNASFKMQNEYDHETNHGFKEDVQAEWLERMARELEKYEKWAE